MNNNAIDFKKLLAERLKGRVKSAYIFGSYARGESSKESDIDLIIITDTEKKFTQRNFDFLDLYEICPRLDMLVYTAGEFDRLTQERKDWGFWKEIARDKLQVV